MPFRNLNEPETHDGTNHKLSFGGPYHLYVSLNGETLYRGEIGKGDELRISMTPMGETEDAE